MSAGVRGCECYQSTGFHWMDLKSISTINGFVINMSSVGTVHEV